MNFELCVRKVAQRAMFITLGSGFPLSRHDARVFLASAVGAILGESYVLHEMYSGGVLAVCSESILYATAHDLVPSAPVSFTASLNLSAASPEVVPFELSNPRDYDVVSDDVATYITFRGTLAYEVSDVVEA